MELLFETAILLDKILSLDGWLNGLNDSCLLLFERIRKGLGKMLVFEKNKVSFFGFRFKSSILFSLLLL